MGPNFRRLLCNSWLREPISPITLDEGRGQGRGAAAARHPVRRDQANTGRSRNIASCLISLAEDLDIVLNPYAYLASNLASLCGCASGQNYYLHWIRIKPLRTNRIQIQPLRTSRIRIHDFFKIGFGSGHHCLKIFPPFYDDF